MVDSKDVPFPDVPVLAADGDLRPVVALLDRHSELAAVPAQELLAALQQKAVSGHDERFETL
jgi:hypothetical protein